MSKAKLFEIMREGKKKQINIAGIDMVIITPDLEDRTFIGNIGTEIINRDKKALQSMAKLVINCTQDLEGRPFFDKGDLDTIIADRGKITEKILYEIIGLSEEEDIEEVKKN